MGTPPITVYYDDKCGFCTGSVEWLRARDRHGRLVFMPLATLPERPALPDSVVVRVSGARLLTRSSAILAALDRLGWPWRIVALAARLLPVSLRDRGYDAIARRRHCLLR